MKKITTLLAFAFIAIIGHAQPSTFDIRGVGGGGALFSAAINPANSNDYFVSCDMGELFHTTTFGTSYTQTNFQQFLAGPYSKVCYTSTSGLLYSIRYINDIGTPCKSTDNGVTWTSLVGNPDPTEFIYYMYVDYNNPNKVVISNYGVVYFSNDGGNTFTIIYSDTSGAGTVLGGALFDGNAIYLGTNNGVLVSTNGGANFSVATITGIPSSDRIWSFAAAKVGTTTRFFCLTANANDIYVGLQGSSYYAFPTGIYSVDYGSGNWVTKSTGIDFNNSYCMFIAMANNDINTVYVAGGASSSFPEVIKTTNAGTSWTQVFNATNNQNINTGWSGNGGDRDWWFGECPFSLAVAPNNSSVAIFTDFGFVHKTNNGGVNWNQAYVDPADQHPANALTPQKQSYHSIGLENTGCWQVAWADANTMWGCYTDIRGIRSTDAGIHWSFNYTGHAGNTSYRVAKHPSNGNLYMATSDVHDMYESYRLADAQLDATGANGKLLYSTDKGLTWQDLHVFNHPVFWITLDPNNANRAYASVIHYAGGTGIGGVYVTNDLNNLASSTWSLLPNPPRTEKHPAALEVLNDGKLVASYSGRRSSTGFTASSGVFVYNPTSNTWADVSATGMQYWTRDVVIDPNDATQNTWYACVFGGFGNASAGLGGLYKTTNRGTTWTNLTGSLVDRVHSCTINPNNPNQLFFTTEYDGLWVSNNINSSTPTFSNVANYPFQRPSRVFFNPYNSNEMWVASMGNGMRVGTMLTTGILDFNTIPDALSVYPNPSKGLFTITTKDSEEATIYDCMGKKAGTIKLTIGNNPVDFSHFANGIYFIKTKTSHIKIIIE